jgi:RNA polymerase sigma factor (sigma-70 family)
MRSKPWGNLRHANQFANAIKLTAEISANAGLFFLATPYNSGEKRCVMEKKPDFIPTRESLLSRLKDWNDDDGWREFFSIYRQLIFAAAIKSGLREDEAEEVVQETVLSVAKTIQEFQYDPQKCRFKSWLGHLAQKRIVDRFRKRARELPVKETAVTDSARTAAIERVPDAGGAGFDALWDEEWRQTLWRGAMERVKAEVSAVQYQMFDFYVMKKMPAGKVARDLGTSTAQVYLAKHRVSRLIKKEIERLQEEIG